MLDHIEINRRFLELDAHPDLLSETFDEWLAWPIVKERLWLACFQSSNGSAPRVSEPIKRFSAGLSQLGQVLWPKHDAALALFYEPREVQLSSGLCIHPHLGNMAALGEPNQILHYRYDWNVAAAKAQGPRLVDNYGIGALVAAGALVLARQPSLRSRAQRLSAAAREILPEVSDAAAVEIIANQLARFRIQSRLMLRLLRRSRVRSVVVLDAFAKMAEVAAARALGLKVLEVQHGMFSVREPAYSWRAKHRDLPGRWPLPDRIAVFGPLWSEQLKSAGFWRGDEVVEAPNPLLSTYRTLLAAGRTARRSSSFRILFSAQGYVKSAGLEILERFLALEEVRNTGDISLRIKMHPLERDSGAEYFELARRYPQLCYVVCPDRDAFQEMAEADCVIGFTSLMLLEALGLGIPAISLRGGPANAGFCTTFAVPQLATAMPEVFTGDELYALIDDWRSPGAFEAQRLIVSESISQIYAFGGTCIEAVVRGD